MLNIKKIVLFTAFYPPYKGDDARFSYYIARELVKLGIEVMIITTGVNKTLISRKIDGILIKKLPSRHLHDKIALLKFGSYKTICSILSKFQPCCVVVNDYYQKLSYLGIKAASTFTYHTILINHLTGYIKIKGRFSERIFHKYEKIMIKKLRRFPAAYAGTSRAQNARLRKYNLSPKYIINDAVDIEQIPIPGMRRKLNISHDAILYLASYDIVLSQLDDIIESFKKACTWSGTEMFLVVYGKCRPLEKDKHDNIIFTGDMLKEDILSLFFECDVYISVCRKEQGLAVDVLEAGTNGCVVLSINIECENLIIIGDDLGVIVKSGDKKKLTSSIQMLRLHNNMRKKLADNLKNYVDSRYSWNQSALALIEAVSEIIGTRRRR